MFKTAQHIGFGGSPKLEFATKQAFTVATQNTAFIVPGETVNILVKLWGAGGGGAHAGSTISSGGGGGGGGGFVQGQIAVTPGETLFYAIGAGGAGVGGIVIPFCGVPDALSRLSD